MSSSTTEDSSVFDAMTPNPALHPTGQQLRRWLPSSLRSSAAGECCRYLPQKETDHVHALVLAGEAR